MSESLNKKPLWYLMFRGEQLPGSQRHGIELARQTLVPLMATVAAVSGRRDGDAKALQHYVQCIKTNHPVVCEECRNEVLNGGHKPSCPLLQAFLDVFAE